MAERPTRQAQVRKILPVLISPADLVMALGLPVGFAVSQMGVGRQRIQVALEDVIEFTCVFEGMEDVEIVEL